MEPATLSRLPRRVLLWIVGITVSVAVVALLSGWTPRRDIAGIVLPFYFATLLAALALAYLVSGNTLMHHYRTATVQRQSSPVWFWSVLTAHVLLAAALFVFGFIQWSAWRGAA